MAIDYQAELMREIEAAFEDGFEGQLEDPWGYADAGWEYQVPPQPAITVVDLAGRLADRVFLARNPGQRGKTLSLGSRKAAERQRILDAEIWPLLRRDSAERTVSQLIFFARHPDVRGRFQQLPKNRQQALSNEFGSIRTAEVQPIFAIPIARGRVKSRTIFIADADIFRSLPALTRTVAGDELAATFAFIGVAEPNAPIRVILLDPNLYPESFNFSDAVVAVTSTIPSAYIDLGFHQQTKNINRTIRRLGGRLSLDENTRVTTIPDRMGMSMMRKFVQNVPGLGNRAIVQMVSAVGLRDMVKFLNDEQISRKEDKLAADPKKWTPAQQRLVGIAVGRAMAHEVRHQYVTSPVHATLGLGSASAPLFGTSPGFSAADRSSILTNIQQLESQQGTAAVLPTYNADDRAGDFPF